MISQICESIAPGFLVANIVEPGLARLYFYVAILAALFPLAAWLNQIQRRRLLGQDVRYPLKRIAALNWTLSAVLFIFAWLAAD